MGGSILFQDLLDIYKRHPECTKIKNFVETGTYHGETCFLTSQYFEKVFTVDICLDFINIAKERCKDKYNIVYHHDTSLNFLYNLLNNPEMNNQSCVFFLDAHSNGDVRSPILDELDLISRLSKNQNVYIIDDVRLFDKYNDWAGVNFESILNVFKTNGVDVVDSYEYNDRFYIFTK